MFLLLSFCSAKVINSVINAQTSVQQQDYEVLNEEKGEMELAEMQSCDFLKKLKQAMVEYFSGNDPLGVIYNLYTKAAEKQLATIESLLGMRYVD